MRWLLLAAADLPIVPTSNEKDEGFLFSINVKSSEADLF